MSRKVRKLVKEVQRMRDEPDTNPNPIIPYRRTVVKTKQWWPFELWRRGQSKILMQYLAIWGVILIVVAICIYFILLWLWELIGW
jgi:hypothetical protein